MNIGKPQLIAALLLLAFVLQCAWLMAHSPAIAGELQLQASESAADPPQHSRLTNLIASLPVRVLRITDDVGSPRSSVASRASFALIGCLLGAAVWYIARRLYGNHAGYVALALYCFSPAMVAHSSVVTPDIVAACGSFGMIWTAVATAHTLYAPREVVLWNWKRIVLLGVAVAMGAGAQYSVALLLLLAIAFMWYLVPHRMGAALAIMGAACGIALLLLLALYGFHVRPFVDALHHGLWAEFSTAGITHIGPWKMLGVFFLGNSPGLVVLMAASLVVFACWAHVRYFGTWAPLVTCVVLSVLAMVMPRAAGFSFLIVMYPFALVFIAGICADLLQAKHIVLRSLATGIIIAVLITHALFSVVGLMHLAPAPRGAPDRPHADVRNSGITAAKCPVTVPGDEDETGFSSSNRPRVYPQCPAIPAEILRPASSSTVERSSHRTRVRANICDHRASYGFVFASNKCSQK